MRTKFAIICLFVMMSLAIFCGCATKDDKVKISTKNNEYYIVVGEKIDLNIMPRDIDYEIKSDDENIAQIEANGLISGQNKGKTHILISYNGVTKSVGINVYDRIVSADYSYRDDNNQRYSTLATAIADSKPDDSIYVCKGRYEESVLVDKDLAIVGEDDVIINSMDINDNLHVKLTNISFYNRDYPGDDSASLIAHSGTRLEVIDCKFFIDKKTDKVEDRLGGYAIYVYPNSELVNIDGSSFCGYKESVRIDSTGGRVDIRDNEFDSTLIAIIVDIRDMTTNMPTNRDTVGIIADNIFRDVSIEVDFRYAGSSYEGKLSIEKHDKL